MALKLICFYQRQRFVRHCTGGGRESTLAVTTTLQKERKELINKDPSRIFVSSGTALDMKILCKEGRLEEALQILDLMDQHGVRAYAGTYYCLLQACINMNALAVGKRVHAHILKGVSKADIYVRNNLVNMYAKCGDVVNARQVFDEMPKRTVVSWNVMITGYAHHGYSEEAFKLFRQMQREHLKPNRITFISVLKACINLDALEKIRGHIITSGFESDVVVGSTLLSMYAKCGSVVDARRVFDNMFNRNVVSWNAMITAYAQQGHGEDALEIFLQMQQEGVQPNKGTFIGALDACAVLAALEHGKRIHAHAIKNGYESDAFVGRMLINMYAKCGDVVAARQTFDKMPKHDVVSWTAMIIGYTKLGYFEQAIKLFWQMQQQDVKPDAFTFANTLDACASLPDLEQGKMIHSYVIKIGYESNFFIGSTLVNMYAKCGSMMDARQVFDKMPKRDVVLWNAMVSGYSQCGHSEEALTLFWKMQQEGDIADNVTFVSVLDACSSLAALEQGMEIHSLIIKSGFGSDPFLGSALINMYAKCGTIESARQLFDKLPKQNVIVWTAMIAGCAQHGHGEEALKLFQQMQQEGVKPNEITFIGILSACSHAGLLDEGFFYFDLMAGEYGMTPTSKHYACMVDLLGRVGLLEEAMDFVQKLPLQPTAMVWIPLLGASRLQGNMEVAKHVAESILELEPQNDAAFVLLSNVYAAAGQWCDKAKVRRLLEEKGGKKKPACSQIEVNNSAHAFVVGDTLHLQIEESKHS